jgi:hypothetical protein
MKKFLVLVMAMIIITGFQVVPVLAANITIWDSMDHNPANTKAEDNTVTYGATPGQIWDIEAFVLKGTKLSVVGGYDFIKGQDGYMAGDIFIDTNNNSPYGHYTASPPGPINIASIPNQGSDNILYKGLVRPWGKTDNSYFKYDYVIHFGRVGNTPAGALDGTYTVYSLSNTSSELFYKINSLNSPAEANFANPYAYISGGTFKTSGTVTQASKSTAQLTGYLGEDIGVTNWPGAVDNHNILEGIDLSFMNKAEFTAHITMSCGNDCAIGHGVVPLPGAVLLLGAGMVRLVAYARRRD